ncbi:MAG: hypothetical protein ACYC99_14730 [Candidatus Geothermincolia bacterium]
MDDTEKGSEVKPPEEKTEEQPVVEAKATEQPKADTGPRKPHNWTHILLIALSVVVVLLLASTISLAVTGNFEHGGRGGRGGCGGCEGCFRQGGGPMMRGFERGQRNQATPPWMDEDSPRLQKRNQQGQVPQSTPANPVPQEVPAPTQ